MNVGVQWKSILFSLSSLLLAGGGLEDGKWMLMSALLFGGHCMWWIDA